MRVKKNCFLTKISLAKLFWYHKVTQTNQPHNTNMVPIHYHVSSGLIYLPDPEKESIIRGSNMLKLRSCVSWRRIVLW